MNYPLFYNSKNGDRVYDADSFSDWTKKLFQTGVMIGECEVTPGGGLQLVVAAGSCNIEGKLMTYDDDTVLTADAADPTYPRIDIVVIERNDEDRDFYIKIVKGTAGIDPVMPEPIREDGIYQIVLAKADIAAGATAITSSNITDMRGDEYYCGIVVAVGGMVSQDVPVPVPEYEGSLVYTGAEQTPIFSGYIPEAMIITGITSATNAGTYTASFLLREGFCWPDRTRIVKNVEWSIGRAAVAVPTVSGNPVYTGQAISPVLSGYNSSYMSLSGDTEATNVGSYTLVVSIDSNHKWNDDTTEDKELEWSVTAASPNLTVSDNDVEVNDTTSSITVTISKLGSGTLSAAITEGSSYVSINLSGNTLTISQIPSLNKGVANIAVSVAASGNYSAQTVNITARKTSGVLLGDWATADDETIVDMVNAADRGLINLNDYWNEGDTRVVTLQPILPNSGSVMLAQPVQQIELVLLYDSKEDTNYELASETASHRNTPSFVVGLKNCLQNLSPIDYEEVTQQVTSRLDSNNSYTDTLKFYRQVASSSNTKLDTWLNENFYNALPNSIKMILKDVHVVYANMNYDTFSYYQGTTGYSANNIAGIVSKKGSKVQKIALPSSYEIAEDSLTVASTSGSPYAVRLMRGSQSVAVIGLYGDDQRRVIADEVRSKSILYSDEGTLFSYYSSSVLRTKKRGISGENCRYYTRTSSDLEAIYRETGASDNKKELRANVIISDSGVPTDVAKADYASTYAGISPIMFI